MQTMTDPNGQLRARAPDFLEHRGLLSSEEVCTAAALRDTGRLPVRWW